MNPTLMLQLSSDDMNINDEQAMPNVINKCKIIYSIKMNCCIALRRLSVQVKRMANSLQRFRIST